MYGTSKVMGQVGEGGEFQELLSGWWQVDDLVLEYPGEVVRDEDGVETCAEGRVYVGAWAVANHPGVAAFAAVVGSE